MNLLKYKYRWSNHSLPVIPDADWDVRFSSQEELTSNFRVINLDAWDFDNYQVWLNQNVNINESIHHYKLASLKLEHLIENVLPVNQTGLVLSSRRMDSVIYFDKEKYALYDPLDHEVIPSNVKPYYFSSGRIDTQFMRHFDLGQPGRMIVTCTLPQGYVCPSAWLFFSEQPGDAHHPGRYTYVEFDLFETGPTRYKPFPCVYFTSHRSKSDKAMIRKCKTKELHMSFDPDSIHAVELVWDGKGHFTWLLDGVVMWRSCYTMPKNVYPYLILSLGIFDPFFGSIDWHIDRVQFKGCSFPIDHY